jgi:pimeloyl-ACP methyl ester carboxylesterase
MDWFSYSRVLPELSKSFHVFAISYHGHGESRAPREHLDAAHIGADLATFVETVVHEPVFVTGNSSGGLLSVWLAANQPTWVRAVLLEDPPLFTAEFPRSTKTVAYRSFATCHGFLEAKGSDDFLLYWLEANRLFVITQAGESGLVQIVDDIKRYRATHPGERLDLDISPDSLRLFIRGLDVYDPNFGDAFYDGRWNKDFDHAAVLQRIEARTLLLHANFSYLLGDTLEGALDDADAARAMSLLRNGSYLRIDAAHTVHLNKPGEFIDVARRFFLGE